MIYAKGGNNEPVEVVGGNLKEGTVKIKLPGESRKREWSIFNFFADGGADEIIAAVKDANETNG
jgi:hypothetical protein